MVSASTMRHLPGALAKFAELAQSSPLVAVAIVVGVAGFVVIAVSFLTGKSAAGKVTAGGSRAGPTTLKDEFQPLKLKEKITVSPDTRIFRFALPSPAHILGLPIGQHMYLKATVGDSEVQRAYTPISSDDDHGHVDLMVKVYFAGVHPKFPEGGKMSQHLEALAIGDSILVKGPTGRWIYNGRGKYSTKATDGSWGQKKTRKIGMIAGGTGITPMLQIIRAVLKDPSDLTEMWLLFANQTEADILLRDELEVCAKDPRFHLWYTLDRPGDSWKYSSGFINLEMVEQRMPAPDADTIILMCGPPPMITYACKPNLLSRGFTAEQMYSF